MGRTIFSQDSLLHILFYIHADRFSGVELEALHSTMEALNARLKRYMHSPRTNVTSQQRQVTRRRNDYAQDDQISRLRSSITKLSLVNSENTKKVKLVESALKNRDSTTSWRSTSAKFCCWTTVSIFSSAILGTYLLIAVSAVGLCTRNSRNQCSYQARLRLLQVQTFCCRNRLYKHVVAGMGVYLVCSQFFFSVCWLIIIWYVVIVLSVEYGGMLKVTTETLVITLR